jgi:Uncharacterized protein conserved in bacteria
MDTMVNFEQLVARKISHIQIKGDGIVTAILNDDLIGRKHQRFVLELAPHKTVLILNNIDIFPRLYPLEIGDRVEFYGEYVWNRHGGIVHWTHHDPKGIREDGYVKVVTDEDYDESYDDHPLIPLGTYRHYKGYLYEALGFATHSESLESMVIYKALYGERKTWVRPLSMWEEIVEVDGKTVKRFELVGRPG